MKDQGRVFLLLLLWSLDSGMCQLSVVGYVGEDVVLPCVYRAGVSASVISWRDGNDLVVLDIIDGKEQTPTQDQKFRGRVSSFSEEYSKGNFSIRLKSLTKEDASTYECHIPISSFQSDVKLTVEGPRVVSPRPVSPRPSSPSPAGGAAASHSLHMALITAPLCVLLRSIK